MSKLVLATFASSTVMGAQVYERAVSERAQEALDHTGHQWMVQHTIIRSLRSPLPGTQRLPVGMLMKAPSQVRQAMAAAVYPRADLVHRMTVGLPPAQGRDILTLHDIVPWLFSDEEAPPAAAAEELRRARAIVTPSHFSAGEIVDMFGVDDPVVIPNGYDRARFAAAQPLAREDLARLGIAGPYVLVAGGASERKNLEGVAAAWPLIRKAFPDLTLLLAGPPHPRRTSLFASMEGVVLVGRVDDSVMPGLMAAAEAILVPSKYEGFGLPALEAMAVGVPVVAADASSLPEVVGPCGILVQPTGEGLAEGTVHAVARDSEVDRMVTAGLERAKAFSWERSAQAHAALWERLIAEGGA